jgi:hypothetical protein
MTVLCPAQFEFSDSRNLRERRSNLRTKIEDENGVELVVDLGHEREFNVQRPDSAEKVQGASSFKFHIHHAI